MHPMRRDLTGVLALHDPFNGPHVVLAIDPPAPPIALNARQKTFALPTEERGPGNIEAAANFICFILSQAFVCNHAYLTE
jgi:hypothetical protein